MHGSRLRRMAEAAEWLERIHALKLPNRVRVLNVCGGHERSIGMAGLRSVLPDTIELIPGPGCPVCVCPEEDILAAIQLAATTGVILVAFGDMLRVPANVARGELRSLAEARGAGADVRAIASPQEAVAIARGNPDRRVVCVVAGFETTRACRTTSAC
jgi:hydrogenase expression/formation protein HypD